MRLCLLSSLSVSICFSVSHTCAYAHAHTHTHTHTLLRTPFQSTVLKFSKTALMLLACIYVDGRFYASVCISIRLSDGTHSPTPASMRYRFGKKDLRATIMAELIWKDKELKRFQCVVYCYFTGKSNVPAPIDLCRMILPLISLRLAPKRWGLIIQGLEDGRKYPLRPIYTQWRGVRMRDAPSQEVTTCHLFYVVSIMVPQPSNSSFRVNYRART